MAFLKNLFGGNIKPDFTGLQIQTATSTLPIPIIWGQTKVGGNIVWYTNFQTEGGGGKGGLFSASTNTYTADLIIALCEGPISTIGTIWRDQSLYTLSGLGLTLFTGSSPQSTWGYLESNYPSQAIAYQGTAFVCAASYGLGDNASIGNHNFEVLGPLQGTGANGIDADPAQLIFDFLTNPQYGAGFDASKIDMTTLYGGGPGSTNSSLQAYCAALGICFSPGLASVEQGSSILNRWLQICNCGAVWSDGLLRFIPYGDAAISAGNVTRTVQTAVPQPSTDPNNTTQPSVQVCAASAFVSDGGVIYAYTGAALAYTGGTSAGSAGTYGINNGAYVFAVADECQVVQITYTYAISRGFAPNLTPIYSLTDLDFVDEKGNKDPVQASRVDPFSLPTIQRVETLSRANEYGSTSVEARDQSQIEIYGPRVGSTVSAHEICDDVTVAPIVAQILLQRALYVRAKFSFKLGWEYCLLDPMDVIEISDTNLGLSNYPVRIVSIEEDDKGLLAITAEELTVGVSTPAANPRQGTSSFTLNRSVAASPVNAPLIFEPPPALTNNTAQVWVGASGGIAGVADPNWGGCYVWLSYDDVSYSNIATINQSLRQGSLTSSLAAASGWDTIDTLSVSLAESGGVLTGTSRTGAQQGATLALVDSELFAYESATLTGTNAYNLTNLERGMYGTAGAAHASSATFARLDGAIVKYNLPASEVIQTLYFKLQSFNIFGGGVEPLSSCAAYIYQPTGAGEIGPVASALAAGTGMDWGHVASDVISEDDDFGTIEAPVYSLIDLGNCTS